MNLGNLTNGAFSCFWETGAIVQVSGGGAVGPLEIVGPDGKSHGNLYDKTTNVKVLEVEEDDAHVFVEIKNLLLNGDPRLTVVEPNIDIEKKIVVETDDSKVDVTGVTTFDYGLEPNEGNLKIIPQQ